MSTAIIGVGNIGKAVATNLVAGGEPVVLAARGPDGPRELADNLGALATAAGVGEAIDEADAVVKVQPALFGELIDILLDNACKFSSPKTPIVVRLRSEAKTVCIQVEDQGFGIPASDLADVFNPFITFMECRCHWTRPFTVSVIIAVALAAISWRR